VKDREANPFGPGRRTAPTVRASVNRPQPRRSFWRRHRRNIEAWSVLGPVMLYMFIFTILPMLVVIYLSFTEWSGFRDWPTWVGLSNYLIFFTDEIYLRSLWQTFYIGAIGLCLGIVLAFVLALLLDQPIRGQSIYRVIWYIPVVTSFAVMSQILLVVLNPIDGQLNQFLRSVGLPRMDWQLSTFWMVFWVVAFGLWKGLGINALLFLAGLQSIDPSLYSAAKIDGANAIQRTRHITLPLLRPIFSFVLVIGIIGMFQIFEPILLITKGGPNGSTTVIVYQLYMDAFTNYQFGMASVGSVVVLIISFIGAVISLRISRTTY